MKKELFTQILNLQMFLSTLKSYIENIKLKKFVFKLLIGTYRNYFIKERNLIGLQEQENIWLLK